MRLRLRTSTLVLILTAAVWLAGWNGPAALADPADDSQKPVIFKSQTTMVQVPAVVTDNKGNHIHGLAKSDFQVFENGAEQKIAILEEVTPSRSRPSNMSTLPNSYTNLLLTQISELRSRW